MDDLEPTLEELKTYEQLVAELPRLYSSQFSSEVENRDEANNPSAETGEDIYDAVNVYLNEIRKIEPLTAKEEAELISQINTGDEDARLHLTKANLRLVVLITERHQGRGLALLDMIVEGNIGLIRSIDNFDSKFGVRFSTYAAWYIDKTIKQAIAEKASNNTSTLDTTGPDIFEEFPDRAQIAEKVILRFGGFPDPNNSPTLEEVAKKLGATRESIRSIEPEVLRKLRQPRKH
jgi:RNA polymerase primary sigma factor